MILGMLLFRDHFRTSDRPPPPLVPTYYAFGPFRATGYPQVRFRCHQLSGVATVEVAFDGDFQHVHR